jgi:murein DD-endopeptidase MepM/ murein hydrolase activator NlpD
MITGAIAWLAASAMPPTTIHGFNSAPDKTFLPYQLFTRLVQSGNASYASLWSGSAPASHPAQAAQGSLDRTLAAEQAGDNANPNPGVDTRTITLDSGDTLAGALQDAGFSGDDASAAVAALTKIYDPRGIRAGQSFDLTYAPADAPTSGPITISGSITSAGPAPDDGETAPANKLLSISFSPSIEHDMTITRGADGSFAATDTVKKLEAHIHRAGATIDSSLYLAAMQSGIPADVVVEMIHMFSYKVDFQRDIRPGDSFEVYYNYYYTPTGQPAKPGDIAYGVMRLGGRQITLYRYQPDPKDPADYFDEHGQSAKGMLMKTPVDGARITSGFGMRFHPVLGYTRMHKGIDFGVPVGTPVMAAGAGTVEVAGRENGYGNFLEISHANGYQTAYGHLSRFAPGVHKGAHVRQGQVVAFSGNTGITTGPHLHYEIRIKEQQVNPTTVKFAQGRKLAGREMRLYEDYRLGMDERIAKMPLETKVADISTDLRQAKAK